MDLHEKLTVCNDYLIEKGYDDASVVRAVPGSEMVVFRVPEVTAKYPNEKPDISVSFSNGNMNSDEIDFDVMQVMCFLSSGIPSDRISDLQKFCSDFNKSMQIGFFGIDYKNESVYFKSTQIIDKNISKSRLVHVLDNVVTMTLFYFGYAYEILIELSFGIIGYGSTPARLRERKRMIRDAMAEISHEEPSEEAGPDEQNIVIEEIFRQLRQENPEILEQADIDIEAVRRRRRKKTRGEFSGAEEAAIKILRLAENERKKIQEDGEQSGANGQDADAAAGTVRETMTESDAVDYKNQMPSVEMYAKREKRKEPPLDLEGLQRALEEEQKERVRINAARREADEKTGESIDIRDTDAPEENQKARTANDQATLLQRLKKWTQN